MTLRFYITRSRRELIPALALVFLLQTLAPAFAGVMASPVSGYIDILCTMSGPRQVFVAFDEQQRSNPPACHECPSCILQLNLDDEAPLASPLAIARTQFRPLKPARIVSATARLQHYSPYLGRAPPV